MALKQAQLITMERTKVMDDRLMLKYHLSKASLFNLDCF